MDPGQLFYSDAASQLAEINQGLEAAAMYGGVGLLRLPRKAGQSVSTPTDKTKQQTTAAHGHADAANANATVPPPTEAYNRQKHYGKTPTAADRKALGAQSDEVLDHKRPLVEHYYEGNGNGGKPGYLMTDAERKAFAKDRNNMERQKRTDSNKQGGEKSKYSKEKKKQYGL